MPEPKPISAYKKSEIKREPEALPKAGYGKRFVYIAVVFVIFIVILLVSRQREERVETPPPTTTAVPAVAVAPPAAPPASTAESETLEKVAEAPEKKNSLPEIVSVKLSPKVAYPGTKIRGEVEGADKDGDEITFNYEWKKSDEIIQGATSDKLDTARFKKGELITLYVTPFDGKDKGKTRFSKTIMIANRPPEITSMPSTTISNGKYIYEVKAADPDNDMLTFSLEEAPSGMTIDPETGVVRWDISPEAKGTHNIRIAATDGDAKAFQIFTLTPEIETK